jgi:HEAT repeat protein
MTKRILNAIIFWCVPAAMLITAGIRREPTYQGKSTTIWVEEMRTNQDSALNALQHMGTGVLPAFKDKLKSSEPTERCRAAFALGKLGSAAKDAVPDLIQTSDDDSPNVQCEAMIALARIGVTDEELVPKLMAKLTNKDTGAFAATLLNSMERKRKADNLPPLSEAGYEYGMACLNSQTPSIRLNGAIQLASVAQKDQRAKAALQSLLNDNNGWVREEASTLITNSLALPNFRLVSD